MSDPLLEQLQEKFPVGTAVMKAKEAVRASAAPAEAQYLSVLQTIASGHGRRDGRPMAGEEARNLARTVLVATGHHWTTSANG